MGTAAQRQSLSSPGCRRGWLAACAVVRWVAEVVMAASVWVVSAKEDGMMVCGSMERKAADGIHDDNGVKKKNEEFEIYEIGTTTVPLLAWLSTRWSAACAVVRWVAEVVMAASMQVVSAKEDGMMVCGSMERKAADGIHDDNGVKKKNEEFEIYEM
ncbi:hypothetical protein Dimus_029250 [Dionaea muscipula]